MHNFLCKDQSWSEVKSVPIPRAQEATGLLRTGSTGNPPELESDAYAGSRRESHRRCGAREGGYLTAFVTT